MKQLLLIISFLSVIIYADEKGIVKVNSVDKLTVDLSTKYSLAILMDMPKFGTFVFDENMTTINNGGTVINGWKRIFNGMVHLEWFGGKAEGIDFDNTPILQKIYDAGYKNVFMGSGTWHFGLGDALERVNVYTGGNIDAKITELSEDVAIIDSRNNRGVSSSIRTASNNYEGIPREELLLYVGTDRRGLFRSNYSSGIQMYTATDPLHNAGVFFSIPSKVASSTNFAVVSPTNSLDEARINKDNFVLITRNSAYNYIENQKVNGLLTLENAGSDSQKPALFFNGGTTDIGYKSSYAFDVSAIDVNTGKRKIMFYAYSPENYFTLGKGIEFGRNRQRIKKAYFESIKVTAHHGSTSINFKDIPTSDPHIIGEIYRQGANLKISMGK